MKKLLNEYIDDYYYKILDNRFLRRNTNIPFEIEYSLRGARKDNINSHPQNIIFNPNYTEYCIILQTQNNDITYESAIIGFNLENEYIDCLQIQGGKGRYKELLSIDWDRVLLNSIIEIKNNLGIEKLCVIPAKFVECDPSTDYEKLVKRYDINARSFGMQYSSDEYRFVLK